MYVSGEGITAIRGDMFRCVLNTVLSILYTDIVSLQPKIHNVISVNGCLQVDTQNCLHSQAFWLYSCFSAEHRTACLTVPGCLLHPDSGQHLAPTCHAEPAIPWFYHLSSALITTQNQARGKKQRLLLVDSTHREP